MARPKHQTGYLKVYHGRSGNVWKGHYYIYDEHNQRHHKAVTLGPCQTKSKETAEAELLRIIQVMTKQSNHTQRVGNLIQAMGQLEPEELEAIRLIFFRDKTG